MMHLAWKGYRSLCYYNVVMCFVKVDENLISKFNYVAGMVPVIKAYISEVG